MHWLNGGEAKPTHVPPRPFEKGVDGRPTLIQNVETLAHVAQIARFGADWFRQTGTGDEPGTTLVTVTGAVARPAIVEVPIGTRIDRIVARAGGAGRADRGVPRRRLLRHVDPGRRRRRRVQPRRARASSARAPARASWSRCRPRRADWSRRRA